MALRGSSNTCRDTLLQTELFKIFSFLDCCRCSSVPASLIHQPVTVVTLVRSGKCDDICPFLAYGCGQLGPHGLAMHLEAEEGSGFFSRGKARVAHAMLRQLRVTVGQLKARSNGGGPRALAIPSLVQKFRSQTGRETALSHKLLLGQSTP